MIKSCTYTEENCASMTNRSKALTISIWSPYEMQKVITLWASPKFQSFYNMIMSNWTLWKKLHFVFIIIFWIIKCIVFHYHWHNCPKPSWTWMFKSRTATMQQNDNNNNLLYIVYTRLNAFHVYIIDRQMMQCTIHTVWLTTHAL